MPHNRRRTDIRDTKGLMAGCGVIVAVVYGLLGVDLADELGGGMGIGGAGIAAVNAMRASRDAGPTWCEKNNCQCPCHKEDESWWEVAVILGLIVGGGLIFVWMILTFVQWAMPYDGPATFVGVLKAQAHWFWELMHRIW
jgi:hypothetical protein